VDLSGRPTPVAPLIAERGLTLALSTRPEPAAVDATVDQVRRRYGRLALTRGVLVGPEPGLEMPHAPASGWDPQPD
jgi:hypothetical protein